jgi:cytidylate kinase
MDISSLNAHYRYTHVPDTPLARAIEIGRRIRVRGRGIADISPPLLPSEGFDHWVEFIKKRVAHHWDAVIVIDGSEGLGKSSLALRLAGALDPTFTVGHICYTGADVMERFRDTETGHVILFDESARDLLGSNAQSVEAKVLAQALMLVREKGLIVILCIPRIHELAPSMRSRRATMWLAIQERGIARVHVRSDRIVYKPDPRDMGFRVDVSAPLLLWKAFPSHSKLWRAYLVIKKAHLEEYLKETAALLASRRGGAPKGKRNEESGREYERRRKADYRARNVGTSDGTNGTIPTFPPSD